MRFLLPGTVHGDDYLLIFESALRQPLRADEVEISKNLIRMLETFAETGKLAYDKCKLRNNVGEEKLQLLDIKRDSCENLQVDRFP